VIALASVVLFMVLLEGGLALFGVNPVLQGEDPLVGFAGNLPLFVEKRSSDGRVQMVTADNKLKYFNPQAFPCRKAPDTYRIFCLGGSTTFGRPYNDLTSFAGWLRELLPEADSTRRYEVINAGGISYASYRVARLMEELARYQPDLFIVYTGQNEFLEERTYGALRDLPPAVRETAGVLARTRTWAFLQSGMRRFGLVPDNRTAKRPLLSSEVDTILDRSAGPERYHRDDALANQVLTHFRVSLERMADIAAAAEADILFVTPASNLKDCSPFKSQHTDGLDTLQLEESSAMLFRAKDRIARKKWDEALPILDAALVIDPRYAELHYRRGKALFALGRFREAEEAFLRARDEDVCPLRALSSMRGIVAEVAAERNIPLVDFVGLLEQKSRAEFGQGVPGKEYFLDHVHPTIDGNRVLAVELVETLGRQGIVTLGRGWKKGAVIKVATRVEGRIDRNAHANALANLAKVLLWAGKVEEAEGLARQAIETVGDQSKIVAKAAKMMIIAAIQKGDPGQAEEFIRVGLDADPWDPKLNYHYAVSLFRQKRMAEGAAHLLLADAFGRNGSTLSLLGLAMFEHGRYGLAYPLLLEARRLNPDDKITVQALAELKRVIPERVAGMPLPKVSVTRYPGGAPHEILQVILDAEGREKPNGIYTEWYEDGDLKRYTDYVMGFRRGIDVRWDDAGRLISQTSSRSGGPPN